MYTSALFLALSVGVVPAEMIPVAPSWRNDYSLALKEGQKSKRPLAIFVGSGPEGWDKISKDGGLDKEAKDLLHNHYVCLYLDTSKENGRYVAEQLDMTNRQGVVIGDVTGLTQAFWHGGTLKNEDLNRYLRKYSDPDLVVLKTERVPEARPTYQSAPPVYRQPSYYAPSYSFGGCSS